jgi:hypothetical protein
MLACHGGLTPPALGASAVRTFAGETATCAIHERSLTRAAGITPLCLLYRVCDRKPESQTIADSRNTQERRASARRGTVSHRQRRACLSERETRVAQLAYARHSWSRERVPLLICVSDRRVRYVCPGRLTPTALGARRYVPSGNSAICAARTHMHKSAERQPAVVRYRPRNRKRFSQTDSLLAPQLAYTSRSWCTAFVRCKMDVLQCGQPRAAGVSPPWFGNRASNTERFLPNEDARMPRGAYAPRSWWFCSADICRRNCDLCDTRTLSYKSGGRQPAVVRVTHRQHRAFLTE